MNEVISACAHGRVNLMGEHTDYNFGYVLPTAIPQRTTVSLSQRKDKLVRARSAHFADEVLYSLGEETPRGDWSDYIQGITRIVSRRHRLGGFDLEIESNIPLGSGLASSAAVEIALLRALRLAFALPMSDLEMARSGQEAETNFVGARVGIMDQMAATFADETHALFLDTLSLEWRTIPLPLAHCELVVIHSGLSHLHASGHYNLRRAECEEACRGLGIQHLRLVRNEDLRSPKFFALPEVLRRRVRHVVSENARVRATADALESADPKKVGELFLQSHASMRDDYQSSLPEIDRLIEIAAEHEDIFGARLTGGGFGGSIVALAKKGEGRLAAQAIAESYAHVTGLKAVILLP